MPSPPRWQPDEEVSECPICKSMFGFLKRRHHCRKCGRVVCSSCSNSKFTYLPDTYVASPGDDEDAQHSAGFLLRTCDDCAPIIRREQYQNGSLFRRRVQGQSRTRSTSNPAFSNNSYKSTASAEVSDASSILTVLPDGDRRQNGGFTSRHGHDHSASLNIQPTTSSMLIDDGDIGSISNSGDNSNECPVCGMPLTAFTSESEREVHVNNCLVQAEFSGSPDQSRRYNRMLVTHVRDAEVGKECPICFEEFEKGEKIGRLECLCVFHRRCIKDWFMRKGTGNCPIHSMPIT